MSFLGFPGFFRVFSVTKAVRGKGGEGRARVRERKREKRGGKNVKKTTENAPYLRAVGSGARVGHREDARPRLLEREVLVGELLSVDGLAAGAVAAGEVAALR